MPLRRSTYTSQLRRMNNSRNKNHKSAEPDLRPLSAGFAQRSRVHSIGNALSDLPGQVRSMGRRLSRLKSSSSGRVLGSSTRSSARSNRAHSAGSGVSNASSRRRVGSNGSIKSQKRLSLLFGGTSPSSASLLHSADSNNHGTRLAEPSFLLVTRSGNPVKITLLASHLVINGYQVLYENVIYWGHTNEFFKVSYIENMYCDNQRRRDLCLYPATHKILSDYRKFQQNSSSRAKIHTVTPQQLAALVQSKIAKLVENNTPIHEASPSELRSVLRSVDNQSAEESEPDHRRLKGRKSRRTKDSKSTDKTSKRLSSIHEVETAKRAAARKANKKMASGRYHVKRAMAPSEASTDIEDEDEEYAGLQILSPQALEPETERDIASKDSTAGTRSKSERRRKNNSNNRFALSA